MPDGKNSFVLFHDYESFLEGMSDADVGKLTKAIFAFSIRGEDVDLPPTVKPVFSFIKKQLIRNTDAWEKRKREMSERGRAGGIKSGESRRTRSEQNEAHASINEQNEANASLSELNEHVNVNVNVNENVNANGNVNITTPNPSKEGKGPKRARDVFVEFSDGNEDLLSALRDFEKSRKLNKSTMTDLGKKRLLTALEKLSMDPAEQISLLNYASDHGWKSVYPIPESKPQQKNSGDSSWLDDFITHSDEEKKGKVIDLGSVGDGKNFEVY